MNSIVKSFQYIVLGLILLSPVKAGAEDTTGPTVFPPLSFGKLQVYVPLTEVRAVYLWDFVNAKSLLGGETPFASIWNVEATFGGISSLEGKGTPFLGFNVALPNPAPNYAVLGAIKPGLFGGRNFQENEWIGGIKASIPIF